jgi:predicted RNase H-like HicB family nuclease
MARHKGYTVSDGKLVLLLEPADEGGYVVTCPLDPELITQAESVEEAFENARDAAEALRESRRKFVGELASARRR